MSIRLNLKRHEAIQRPPDSLPISTGTSFNKQGARVDGRRLLEGSKDARISKEGKSKI